MRSRLTIALLVGVSLVFGLLFARQVFLSRGLPREAMAEKKLRLLTYSTFVGVSGPGAEILQRFEKETGAKVEVVTATDAGLLLERLKLGQASVPFDVVVGIDQLLVEQARTEFQWKAIEEDRSQWAPEAAAQSDAHFSAFDWSPLTFVYKNDGRPVPAHFDEILSPAYDQQWGVQDPHASTPGLQFFHWVKALKGDQTAAWLERFQKSVKSVSPTWAFSYGLFKKNQLRFVFSYVTSLAFHWGDESDRSYQVLNFPEGHPVQVELMAIPESCRECDLAQSFVKTMHSDWAQKVIMQKNYMFPVLKGLTKGTIFGELPQLKTIPTETGKHLSEWDQVFSH